MSSPPPGYNPEISQLQGGTNIPIMKVMGGGGVPEGYNETQSLLQGGTDVPIVKMTGGADDSFLEDLEELPKNVSGIAGPKTKKEVEGKVRFAKELGPGNISGKTKTKNGKTPLISTPLPAETDKAPLISTPLQSEIYTPKFSEEDTREINTFLQSFSLENSGVKQEFNKLIASFKARSMKDMVRYGANQKTQTANIPTFKNPATAAHKFVEILPSTTQNIVVVPPIQGRYETFIRAVEFLYSNDVIGEDDILINTVVVFMAPFFSVTEKDQQSLLYSFLQLKEKNPESVYILHNTEDEQSRAIGAELYKNILVAEGDGPLLNFLNPSYIVLPRKIGKYEGLLFSSVPGIPNAITFPTIKNSKAFLPASKILSLKKRAFSFNAGPGQDDTFLKYLTIVSQNDNTPLPPTKLDVPPCENLVSVFDLTESPFQISAGENLYVLRLESSTRPFMCSGIMDVSNKFQSKESDPTFTTAPTIDVYVDGVKWKFRNPIGPKPENKHTVVENWKKGVFSTSEAGFLNHLNISPYLLGLIFKSDIWKEELAGFMENMVSSGCFDDTVILSKGSCEKTRAFLTKVFNYMFINEAITEDELIIPPLKLPQLSMEQNRTVIDWPPELEEIDPHEYKKVEGLDSLDVYTNINKDVYSMDMIVIHKKTFTRSVRRLRIDRKKTDGCIELLAADPPIASAVCDALRIAPLKPEIVSKEEVFEQVLQDLADDHPDFLFIY
jgi:hypothetical protein